MPDPSRRNFAKFLLASPLLLQSKQLLAAATEQPLAVVRELIEHAADAIDIFDFEAVAANRLSEAHYTYLSMGVQHEVTLRANSSAFDNVKLQPRRLVGSVKDVDLSTELFGEKLSHPIILSPVGSQGAFHPEAELASARAAEQTDSLQILSGESSKSLQDVTDARGAPVWSQMYTTNVWMHTSSLIEKAEEAGSPTLVLTVDVTATTFGQNRDRLRRFDRNNNPQCQACHETSTAESIVGAVVDAGDAVGLNLWRTFENLMILDWEYVDRIREATNMNLVLKGIMSAQDARLAIEHGVDGIIVSNHGGRGTDTGLSTIEVLPSIVDEVKGEIPVLIDSGFRRGTDIFKALALGADAICVGRPYVWGLASFGQEGVEAALVMLKSELDLTMRGMGTPNLGSITRDFIWQ
jgi:isopentenyl diphosphate isomerase/L-lactate dehydrogenase-like FMN-dependent dehydrogenase